MQLGYVAVGLWHLVHSTRRYEPYQPPPKSPDTSDILHHILSHVVG